MLFYNGKIYTCDDAGVIQNGYIEIDGKKIIAVGSMDGLGEIPADSTDLKGKKVFPGFVDAHTHIGMCEDSLGFEGEDINEDTDPSTPHLRSIDAINFFDRCFSEAVSAGVTCAVTGPGSANPIAGQMTALKTGGRVDKMIIEPTVSMKLALGENPKTTYHAKNQTPVTRMATAAVIREQLFKTENYEEDMRKAAEDDEIDKPEFCMKCEAMRPLLNGTLSAHVHAHRADDILTALRIGEEFGLKIVIVHGTDAVRVADIIKKNDTPVLCGPALCDRSKPELSSQSLMTPAKLCEKGIKTAIITDHPVTPIQYLPICAALAVREGMDYMQALMAITINPAEICGLDDRVGSLKAGKDADFVIADGEPLDLLTKPCAVYINGDKVF